MSGAVAAFYALLCTALVLYVYRVAVAGVNMSLLRLLLVGWTAWCTADLLRGRVRLERRHWPMFAIGAGILVVNAIDFLTLGGYPALRRDIANHVLNLLLAGLVTVYVSTEVRRVAMLRAFVWSSLVTSAITAYSAVYDRLPFESLIRTLGSEQAQALAYISDDTLFTRATAAFYDPNFYGIYSLLVLVAVVYLWLFDRPARYLVALFALNLVCLSLTLSRTATVGVFVAMALTFLLSPRSRWFAVSVGVAATVMLYASTTVQSHEGRARLRAQVAAAWEGWTTPDDGQAPRVDAGQHAEVALPDASGAPAASVSAATDPLTDEAGIGDDAEAAARTAAAVQARVLSRSSLDHRMELIRRGAQVFRASPLWGSGSASLLSDITAWSSAHVTYLTLLARYGLLGTAVYMVFLLYPLACVWLRPHTAAGRFLVTVTTGALLVVYLGYDILLFFEIQYLFFGLAYSVAADAPA